MCGLFGCIRSATSSVEVVASVVDALGAASEERGRDSSGLAVINPKTEFTSELISGLDPRNSFTSAPGVAVAKSTGAFRSLDLSSLEDFLDDSRVFLGHTRAATQGGVDDLANASPLLAGALLGTHNGDVDVSSVPQGSARRREALGQTDTEIVFRALNLARKDRRKMTSILRSVRGRAALAFYDFSQPDRMYLARTALSPLCYAYDQCGNFYYASNPDWFRRIQKANKGVQFSDVTLIPEGHLLTVSTANGSITDSRRFTPTCRERDLGLIHSAVYRGFTSSDKAIDMSLHRHRVLHSLGAWPSPVSVSVQPSTAIEQQAFDLQPQFAPIDADDDLDSLPSLDNGIDIEEAERLCWNGSEFDFHTFESLLSLDRDQAEGLMERLRAG